MVSEHSSTIERNVWSEACYAATFTPPHPGLRMEEHIMAAFIKRMFNIKHREIHQDWASREEREQFRRQREEWKNTLYIAGLLR